MTEHALQTSCVRWFRRRYPQYIIFAIPNGGARSKTTGAMLKEEGVLAGMPDLCLPAPHGQYHGMWIEMKTEKGRVRDSQKKAMAILSQLGYKCNVCRSFDDFKNAILEYFNEQGREEECNNPHSAGDDYNVHHLRRMCLNPV